MKTFSTNAILSITALIAVGTSAAAQKFDYSAIPAGRDKCALINIAMDESTSTRNERDFIIDTALQELAKLSHLLPTITIMFLFAVDRLQGKRVMGATSTVTRVALP